MVFEIAVILILYPPHFKPQLVYFLPHYSAVNITDNLFTKQGNVGLKSAVYNQEQFQIKNGL